MKMSINGKPADAFDKSVINIINPATGQIIDTVPNAGEEDVARAVEAAQAAQKIWAKVAIHQRATILRKFIQQAIARKEELAQLLMRETGKPIYETRMELDNIPNSFEAFIEKGKHLYGNIIPNGSEAGQENNLQLVIREPVGVVACIVPFNFPLDLFTHKAVPALMAGNAVILKPPHQNPLTLCTIIEMLIEAGVDKGVIQVLTGDGPKVGAALTAHPGVHKISFTGSTAAGIEVAKAAANHLAHVSLELGGNDPFIVHEDADLDQAAQDMIWGRMFACGQVCCASKRFLIHNRVKEEFVKKAIENIKKLNFGDPADENTNISCLVSEAAAKQVEAQVAIVVQQGGRVVCGGKRNGAFYEPTLIVDVPKTSDVAMDMEIFGPVIPIIGFDSIEEAIEIANSSKYGLGGCVFTSNMKTAMKVSTELECGMVVINGSSCYRSFEMPFGGHKYSGIGSEGVLSTYNEVTQLKTIVMKNIVD
jgi:succinate-semialdehyde dehydrogenase/glutarate-semialdehyde dehydrogenase